MHIFQTLGNDNKGAKLEDQQCESGAHRLKVRYHQTYSSRAGLYSFNPTDFCDATQEATTDHGLGRWMIARGSSYVSTAILLDLNLTKSQPGVLNSPFV